MIGWFRRLRRAGHLAAVLLPSVLLSGCGIVEACGNKCPPGKVHNSLDCGCMDEIKDGSQPSQPTQSIGQYYITRRYYCADVETGADRGDCNVTTRANSCQDAQRAQDESQSSVGDTCRLCAGILDTSRRWTGRVEAIQDGPCRGWTENELNYSPVPRDFATSFLHIMRAVAKAPEDNSIASCQVECLAGSPYCLRVAISDKDDKGLANLKDLIAKRPTQLVASDLLRMFRMQDDPCNRSDTTLVDGNILNRGPSTCALTTQVPNSDATLTMPEVLRGHIEFGSEGAISALFSDPKTRAKLHFSNPLLDADWGGDVVAVFAQGNGVNFSVGTNSCIRASLK
jgi:hypothetical protein